MHRKRPPKKGDGTEQEIEVNATDMPIRAIDDERDMLQLHENRSQERDPTLDKDGRRNFRMTDPPPKFLGATFNRSAPGQCAGELVQMKRRPFEEQGDHGTECPEIARIETDTKLEHKHHA